MSPDRLLPRIWNDGLVKIQGKRGRVVLQPTLPQTLHSSKKPRKRWTLELGANASDEGVQFRVWAPRVSSLSLKIAGEQREISATREHNGYFSTYVSWLKSGTRYFYLLNGKQERPDPVSRSQPGGVHGPSEVINPREFKWEDQDWAGISLERMIF